MKGISTIALGAVDAALLLVLAALWLGGASRWVSPAAVAPDLTIPANGLDFAAHGSYQVTLERPLFSPNRRPPPVVAEKAEEPAVDPFKDIRLYGLFDSGGMGGAIVSISGAKPKRVHFGEKIGEWTLRAIDGRNLVLVRDAETRTLRLAYAAVGQSAAQPLAAAPKPATAPAVPAAAANPGVGTGSNTASSTISKPASDTESKSGTSAKSRATLGPPSVQPAAKPTPGAAVAPPSSSVSPGAEELVRDRLAQRAERRTQHGLPLTTQ